MEHCIGSYGAIKKAPNLRVENLPIGVHLKCTLHKMRVRKSQKIYYISHDTLIIIVV